MTLLLRAQSARRTGLAALVTLIPAVLIHEIISFGLLRPLIRWSDAGCIAGEGCVGIAVVVIAAVMIALPAAVVLAVAGAARVPRLVLAGLWLAVCLVLLFSVASGYRCAFGATWLWHEPFFELMAHHIVTPAILLAGLIVFDRLLPRSGPD